MGLCLSYHAKSYTLSSVQKTLADCITILKYFQQKVKGFLAEILAFVSPRIQHR